MSEKRNYAEIDWDDAFDGVAFNLGDPNVIRELVADTETTGFLYDGGDRVVEIGIVEIVNRRETGRIFHCYIDPKRDVPEEAREVHGLSRDDLVKLSGGRGFEKFADKLAKFVGNSPLVAHNATFDMNFLNAEMSRCGRKTFKDNGNKIIDTLLTANLRFPNQRNNLNALCSRFSISTADREFHGALLDASLLSSVYNALTVSQKKLDYDGPSASLPTSALKPDRLEIAPGRLKKAKLSADDLERHTKLCERITKSSGGKCLATSFAPGM